MPHYTDGTQAWVGDVVVGATYNNKGESCGVITEITSEGETCNCKIQLFITNTKRDGHIFGRLRGPQEFDYSEIKALKKVL